MGRNPPEGYSLDTYNLTAFTEKVLEPVGPGGDLTVTVPTDAVVIVEGMFVHRDERHRRWDLSVFLDVPFSVSVRPHGRAGPDRPSGRRGASTTRDATSAA